MEALCMKIQNSRILKISSPKTRQPRKVHANFQNFPIGNFSFIRFCSWDFRNFRDWMVRISEGYHFWDFLETLPGNFCTILCCSEIFGSFGRQENAHRSLLRAKYGWGQFSSENISILELHIFKNQCWDILGDMSQEKVFATSRSVYTASKASLGLSSCRVTATQRQNSVPATKIHWVTPDELLNV